MGSSDRQMAWETEIPAICGGQDPHLATLCQRKGRQCERLPSSARAAEGVGFAWNLLRGGGESWTRLSGWALPSRLGTLRSFRHSIPLAGYSALRPPTVICSLLCLPPGLPRLPPGLPAPAGKLAVTALVSGQPEGGPAFNS